VAEDPTHTAVRGVTAVDASTTTHDEVRVATTGTTAATTRATTAATTEDPAVKEEQMRNPLRTLSQMLPA